MYVQLFKTVRQSVTTSFSFLRLYPSATIGQRVEGTSVTGGRKREKEGEKAIVLCTIMPSDHYHQRRRNRFFLWRSYSYFFCFTLEPSITVPSFCDSASASSVYLLKQSCSVLVAVEDTGLFSSFFLHSLRRHCVSLCTSRVYLPLCLLYLANAANCAMAPHGQRQPPLVLFP